jgi:hypothetical protein
MHKKRITKKSKLLSFVVVWILIFSGICVGISVGKELKKNINNCQTYEQKIMNDKFEIVTKYSYIRSYPGGGGIFIIDLNPKADFSGYVSLEINADPHLFIELDKTILNKKSQIAELTIQPDKTIEIKTYEIVITANYHQKTKHITFLNWINRLKFPLLSFLIKYIFNRLLNIQFRVDSEPEKIVLEVEMFDWSSDNLPIAIIKRGELINWLENYHPEFGTFTGKDCYSYVTYPAHLIVEHWTFLYEDWELRICYHVMIPPYDWSMLWLRERGEFEALFAAKRESDGTTYEISIDEYPIFYGY